MSMSRFARLTVLRERLRFWARLPGYLREDLRDPERRPAAVRFLRLLASLAVQVLGLVPTSVAMYLFGRHTLALLAPSGPPELREPPPEGPFTLGFGLVALGLLLTLFGRVVVRPPDTTTPPQEPR